MDNGKLNDVVFLDIKKAFDSINHGILLNKMNERFGIIGIYGQDHEFLKEALQR